MPAVGGYSQPSYPAVVLWAGWEAVIRRWDGVELWLTGLVLPLQVAILMLVLLPICWLAARAIDWVIGEVFKRLGRRDAKDARESR